METETKAVGTSRLELCSRQLDQEKGPGSVCWGEGAAADGWEGPCGEVRLVC